LHEGIEIHGRAKGVRHQAGLGRIADGGGLPEGRHQPGDLLQLEKYAGLLSMKMRRLRELKDENARLKRIVADLALHRERL
jgi:hypothetical protein